MLLMSADAEKKHDASGEAFCAGDFVDILKLQVELIILAMAALHLVSRPVPVLCRQTH